MRKTTAPIPSIDHSATIAELRAAKAKIASRLTGAGYTLADKVIDSHVATKRGISDTTARIRRCSVEIEALDEAIAVLEGRA